MSRLRIILGDQLSFGISALVGLDPERDIVLMMEVMEENTYVPHHKQKIVLVLSAMRHFADELRQTGVTVDYVTLEDPENTGDLTTELRRAVARHTPDRVMVTEPGEWRVLKKAEGWAASIGLPVEIRADDRFLQAAPVSQHGRKVVGVGV